MRAIEDHVPAASADQTSLRRTNLALVLGHLRDHGPRSRATLASELGLTRGAVSSLTAELVERGLVRTGGVERGGVGRPGTTVDLDVRAVAGIGAEVNVNHVATMALDLGGSVVVEHRRPLDARRLSAAEVLDHLVDLVDRTVSDLEQRDLTPVGLTLGVAGLVDRTREVLAVGANLGWHDVEVASMVRERLARVRSEPLPVVLDNEGNLAALAEATPGDPERQDILVIFGEVGLGGGIVAESRLLRGRQGYAGEFGHMIVNPGGNACACGRTGCWETVSGLRALLGRAADPDDALHDPAMALEDRLAELVRRADLGDTRTLTALQEVGRWVGIGSAVLANALNPSAIVLSGYFAVVGHHMRDAVESALGAGVLAPDGGGTRVELSTLGFTAAVRGGAWLALQTVFADPTRVERRPATAGASQ